MPNVTCDYMMSEESDPVINIRTVPGGAIPNFPAMQLGPFCLYPSKDQLHSMLMAIVDYLKAQGYYEDVQFEDDDIISISHDFRVDVEETFLAVAAEAVTG